jgi:hypothetical protein
MRAPNSLLALALVLAASLAAFPAAAQAPPSCAVALTDPCLLAMLQQMGLEPKPLSKGFLVAIKQGTWTNNIQVVISANGKKVGFNSNLGLVTEAAITAAQWKALLVSNGDIDPSAFYYDPERTKLYLHRSIDNRAITAAILRTDLDSFSNQIVSTGPLWTFTH